MEFRKLGNTEIDVSLICLGTMTFGEQNTEAEAHEQLDYALEREINFIDCAEMYPVPGKQETQGRTEEYIGNWMKERGNRDKVVLASKITGISPTMTWIRGDKNSLDKANIMEAIEGNLKRLKTDYLDLYQLHWPDRKTNFFGQLDYVHKTEELPVAFEETLEALEDLKKQGKIRNYGLSNETAWGAMKWLQTADKMGLDPFVSIQNPYSLLNRSFEVGLAEVSHREKLSLLAYSPLAFGVLSGKYLNGQRPKGTRLELFGNHFTRYFKGNAGIATEKYCKLAQKHGLEPAQMALAFVNQRSFMTSNIIGATTMEQLKTNIDSIDIKLSKEVMEGIEMIHKAYPNPAP